MMGDGKGDDESDTMIDDSEPFFFLPKAVCVFQTDSSESQKCQTQKLSASSC